MNEQQIIEQALEKNEELSFLQLAEIAGYNNEELQWAKIFWEATFNSSWIYVSRQMLIHWFGYSEKTDGIYGKFIKALEKSYEINIEFFI